MKANDWQKASAVFTQMQTELQSLQTNNENNDNNTSGKWNRLEKQMVSARMKLADVAEKLIDHTLNASKEPTSANVYTSGSKKTQGKAKKTKKTKGKAKKAKKTQGKAKKSAKKSPPMSCF